MVHANLRTSVSQDFEQIWSQYAGGKNTRLEHPLNAKGNIRAVHKFACVAAILSKGIAEHRPENERVFLKEFSSDGIHLLHTLLVGDLRGGHFYLRSAVENVWRHVYFKDHPVEYRWANLDAQVYQSIDDIRSYCKKTDEIDARLHKSLDRIAGGYRKLSEFVHSSGTPSLQLDEMLIEIQLSTKGLNKIVSYLRAFGRDMILVCLVLHAREINDLHPLERNYAINYLDKPRKKLRLDVLS